MEKEHERLQYEQQMEDIARWDAALQHIRETNKEHERREKLSQKEQRKELEEGEVSDPQGSEEELPIAHSTVVQRANPYYRKKQSQDNEDWDKEPTPPPESQKQRERRMKEARQPRQSMSYGERVRQQERLEQAQFRETEIPMYTPSNGPNRIREIQQCEPEVNATGQMTPPERHMMRRRLLEDEALTLFPISQDATIEEANKAGRDSYIKAKLLLPDGPKLVQSSEQSQDNVPDYVVSQPDPITFELIEQRINQAIEKSKLDNTNFNNNSLLNQSGKLQIEVISDQVDNSRSYKLTTHTKLDSFKDFLLTELRSKKLDYILEKDDYSEIDNDKLKLDKSKVRDILINHIDNVYHNRVLNIDEPKEVFNKLKEIKLSEFTITADSALSELLMFKHKLNKSTAHEFIDLFNAKVRRYESLKGAAELPKLSVKSMFYNAIKESLPDLETADFLTSNLHGEGMNFEQLKAYFIRKLPKTKPKPSTSLYTQGKSFQRKFTPRFDDKGKRDASHITCRNCGKKGHHPKECRQARTCFNCQGKGHMAKDCPTPKGTDDKADGNRKRPASFDENTGSKRPRFESHTGGNRGKRGTGYQGFKPQGRQPFKGTDTKQKSGTGESLSKSYLCNIDDNYNNITLEKFIIDSGATDHLTNSKLIFKHLDISDQRNLTCANKNNSAKLQTQGSGSVEIELEDGSKCELNNVLYAKDLSYNLLSLKKFVNTGLSVYMDDKIIDIYDPDSNKTFLKGLYEEPFWIVELRFPDVDNKQGCDKRKEMKIFVASNEIKRDYITRNKDLRLSLRNEVKSKKQKAKENKKENKSKRSNKSILEGESAPFETGTLPTETIESDPQPNEVVNERNDSLKETNINQGLLWHIRLGHVGFEKIKQLKSVYSELKDLNLKDVEQIIKECEICKMAKMNKLPFLNNRAKATERLQIIHADIMGPITPSTFPKGYRFIVIFVDNFSKYARSYPLKGKNEAADALDKYITECNNMFGSNLKVCYLDCDQGTEFTGNATLKVLNKYGAELRTVCPYTPQLNGSSEKFNQTIQKLTRAYMFDSRLPSNAWDLALKAATYAYNLTPHRSINMNSPLCKFKPEKKTNINRLKRFGCVAFAKLSDKPETKFGPLATKAILVGYTETGYKLLCPDKGKIVESRNVEFIERRVYGDVYKNNSIKNWEVTNVELNDKTWLLRDNTNSKSEGEVSSKSEGVSSSSSKSKEKKVPTALLSLDKDSLDLNCESEFYALLASIQGDPKTFREAMTRPDRSGWERAIGNEREAFEINNVAKLVPRPSKDSNGNKPTIIDSRWLFKTKHNELGKEEKKARLVIRGFKDKNVYDLKETYAPVSRLPLVRTLLALVNKLGLTLWQLDVKTAFLHSEVKHEIYMEIPEGFGYSDKDRIDNVWMLLKSLYGLRTSPKSWNDHFTRVAEKIGLKRSCHDPCVYIHNENSDLVIVLIYVDDMLVAGNNIAKMTDIRHNFSKELNMKFLGEPKEFLSIKITRDYEKQILEINQSGFIEKMLSRFGYRDIKPMNIPMAVKESRSKERKDREDEPGNASASDIRRYREIIGSLLYIVNVYRSDIAYTVNVLSRHQLNPTHVEWKMIERLFRYLQYSKDYSLIYKGTTDTLEAYSDSSFCDCNNALTTSGYVIRLFGDTIAWRTHKQTRVSLSTCQAEYIAMSDACRELMSIYLSLQDMTISIKIPLVLWCDNAAAVASTQKDGGEKLRHIPDKEAHYIKESVDDGWVIVEWVRSELQLADIYTKALPFDSHSKLVKYIFNF